MEKKKKTTLVACALACGGLLLVTAMTDFSNVPLSLKADTASKSVIFGTNGNHIKNHQAATVLAEGSLSEGSSIVYSYQPYPSGTPTYGENSSDPVVNFATVQQGTLEYSHIVSWYLIISLNNITRVDVSYSMTSTNSATIYSNSTLTSYTDSGAQGQEIEYDEDTGDRYPTSLPANQTSVTYIPTAQRVQAYGNPRSIKILIDMAVSNGPHTGNTGTFILSSVQLTWAC